VEKHSLYADKFTRLFHLLIQLVRAANHKNLNTIRKQNYQEPGVEAELNFEFFKFTIICSK